MTTLQLLSREDSLRAECGCSIDRKGQPDPETGAVAGMGVLKACALHGAAGELLAALRDVADTLQTPLAQLERRCVRDEPHNHALLRALVAVTQHVENAIASAQPAPTVTVR